MSKLPIITSRQLINALQRAGFIIHHQKGSHIYLKHPDGRRTGIPFHKKDIGKGLLRTILKQAGLSTEEFRELL
ncbi:type II toxin-antitoxin system HicA family toxin [bacterium]|nr:type II toxin-antitoxin system HicA family toxin [bacterium]